MMVITSQRKLLGAEARAYCCERTGSQEFGIEQLSSPQHLPGMQQ